MWNGTSLCVSFFSPQGLLICVSLFFPIGFIYFLSPFRFIATLSRKYSVPRKLPSMSTPPQLSHLSISHVRVVNLQFITIDETYFVTSLSPRVRSLYSFHSWWCRQCKITCIHLCSCPMELFHRSQSPLCSAYSFLSPPPTSSLGFWWFLYFPSD